MKSYIQIDGKQIEISEETAENLRKQFSKEETKSEDISVGYEMVRDIDWDKKEKVLIKDKPEKRIFINQNFADNSEFGDICIFIKCKFGSDCKFGSGCEFGSCCKFGSGCDFGSCCDFGSGCKFENNCEFGSCCDFGSGCEFGSCCDFESGCIKDTPYWDEKGKHE